MNLKTKLYLDRGFTVVVYILGLSTVIPMFMIFWHIFKKGFFMISFDFLSNIQVPPGDPGGGIYHAIAGTGILVLTALILSVPISVGAGIFVWKNQDNIYGKSVALTGELLQGIPSIIMGIIGYTWVVRFTGFSAVSGGFALSLITIPIIMKCTEESFRRIPVIIMEAGTALGASEFRVITRLMIPTAFSGIFNGVLLGTSRISGETAPLIFTAFGSPFLSYNLLKPVNSLPHIIYNFATSGYEDWVDTAWGASFVLLILVIILNLTAKWVNKKWTVKY
jgi:phosphate transport system permease protein